MLEWLSHSILVRCNRFYLLRYLSQQLANETFTSASIEVKMIVKESILNRNINQPAQDLLIASLVR